jgi:SAM-dependent methyltransferase
VICNLVFEWCAYREKGDPRVVQRRLLNEMSRVLKPGGCLYLATKNRFALRYLLGGRDEHVQHIRFGSALPRSVQRMALRLLRKGNAAGSLYSYSGLKRMLEQKELDVVQSYWACPEFRHPEQFIATDGRTIRSRRRSGKFRQGDTRATALLMPLVPSTLVKHVTPGLAFVARKRKLAASK